MLDNMADLKTEVLSNTVNTGILKENMINGIIEGMEMDNGKKMAALALLGFFDNMKFSKANLICFVILLIGIVFFAWLLRI